MIMKMIKIITAMKMIKIITTMKKMKKIPVFAFIIMITGVSSNTVAKTFIKNKYGVINALSNINLKSVLKLITILRVKISQKDIIKCFHLIRKLNYVKYCKIDTKVEKF